jgi:hypothetical protein
MAADAERIVTAGPEASLEARVTVLEGNLSRLRDKLDRKVQDVRREPGTVREGIERETQERQAADATTTRIIEEVEVGGLHLEAIGLAWLLLGALGTTFPDEIAATLCRIAQALA